MPAHTPTDNFQSDRGYGQWKVVVYAPESEQCPIINGYLSVGKDFHVFYLINKDNGERKYIASFPSQNVAYVRDIKYVHDYVSNGS